MVLVGGRPEHEREESESAKAKARFKMAMGQERSRSLHNFSLPCLKWGGQKQLQCVRFQADDGGGGGGGSHLRAVGRRSPPGRSGGVPNKPPEMERKRRSVFEPEIGIGSDGIEAVRKKLMLDLQTEMDRMKSAVLSDGSEEIAPPTTTTEDPPSDEARPWNLRTRRSVCKESNASGGAKSQRFEDGNSSFASAKVAVKSPAIKGDVDVTDYGVVKRPRAKLSVPLSKQEIEEDFIAMTGIRPPRRPKKRPRAVQKQLDTLFPGLWLSEITADMYKVNENQEARKR